MKNLIYPSALLIGILLFATSCAKQSLDFSPKFLENKQYLQTTTSNSKNEVHYSGNEELIDILLSKNGENPQIIETTSTIIASIQTKDEKNEALPFEIKYIQTSQSNPDGMIQKGDIFYGTSSATNSLKIDSTSSPRLTAKNRDLFFKILEKGYETLLFEGKEMVVGDTLISRIPMSLPMYDRTIEMFIVTTYTLLSIKEEIANFDINQTVNLDAKYDDFEFSATGSGDGHSTYSIKNHYLINNTSTFTLEMNISHSDLLIEMKSTSLSEVEVVITDRE